MADATFNVNLVFKAMDTNISKMFVDLKSESGKALDEVDKGMNKANKGAKNLGNTMGNVDLSFMSLLFGGMQLQRLFGGMFNSIVDGFRSLSDENNAFNKSVTHLGNSFDFLKYSFGRAFAESPIIQSLIEGVGNALDWLSDWVGDNPNIAATIVSITGALAGLGAALQILSLPIQVKNIFSALKDMFGKPIVVDGSKTNVKVEGFPQDKKTFIGKWSGLPTWAKNMLTAGVLFLGNIAVDFLFDKFNTILAPETDVGKFFDSIGDFLINAAPAFAIVNWKAGLIAFTIGISFKFVEPVGKALQSTFEGVKNMIDNAEFEIAKAFSNGAETYIEDGMLKITEKPQLGFFGKIKQFASNQVDNFLTGFKTEWDGQIPAVKEQVTKSWGVIYDSAMIKTLPSESLKNETTKLVDETISPIKQKLNENNTLIGDTSTLITTTLIPTYTNEKQKVDELSESYERLARAKKDSTGSFFIGGGMSQYTPTED